MTSILRISVQIAVLTLLDIASVDGGVILEQSWLNGLTQRMCRGRNHPEKILFEHKFAEKVVHAESQNLFPTSTNTVAVNTKSVGEPVLELDDSSKDERILIIRSDIMVFDSNTVAATAAMNGIIDVAITMPEVIKFVQAPTTFAISVRLVTEGIIATETEKCHARAIFVICRAVSEGPLFRENDDLADRLKTTISKDVNIQTYAKIRATKEAHLNTRTQLTHELRNSYNNQNGFGMFVLPSAPDAKFDIDGSNENKVLEHLILLKEQGFKYTIATALVKAGPVTLKYSENPDNSDCWYLVLLYTWDKIGVTTEQDEKLKIILTEIHGDFASKPQADLAIKIAALRTVCPMNFSGASPTTFGERVVGINTQVTKISVPFNDLTADIIRPIILGSTESVDTVIQKTDGIGFGVIESPESCILVITTLDTSTMSENLLSALYNISASVILGLQMGITSGGVEPTPFGQIEAPKTLSNDELQKFERVFTCSYALKELDNTYVLITCEEGDGQGFPKKRNGTLISKEELDTIFNQKLSEMSDEDKSDLIKHVPLWLAYTRKTKNENIDLETIELDNTAQHTAKAIATEPDTHTQDTDCFCVFPWDCYSSDTLGHCLGLGPGLHSDMLTQKVESVGCYWAPQGQKSMEGEDKRLFAIRMLYVR